MLTSKIQQIIFFPFFFALFSVAGFLTTKQIIAAPDRGNITNSISKEILDSPVNQALIVVIEVDDLSLDEPRLISTWLTIYRNDSSPSLFFKSIYPSLSPSEKLSNIGSSFSLNTEHQPSEEFFTNLNRLNIQWSGYIIIDRFVKNQFLMGLNNQSAPELQLSDTSQNTQAILFQEKEIFEQTCQLLISKNNGIILMPNWQNLIPSHIQTDIPDKYFSDYWSRIISADNLAGCKVLVE